MESRKECFHCKFRFKCLPIVDYGSIYCKFHREDEKKKK